MCITVPKTGMNAAIRAVTRMGIYVGAKVYLINEVNKLFCIRLDIAKHAHKAHALVI